MGAAEANVHERRDFGGYDGIWRRNPANESLGSNGEPRAEILGWGERNDDAQQRALIGAENEVLRPRSDELGVPVAEARSGRRIRRRLTTEFLEEGSCAPKGNQPTARGEMDGT